jgi:serine/threonine-protein kinase
MSPRSDPPDRSGGDAAWLERVEAVLERVLSLPEAERTAALDALSGDDAVLRAAVATHLEALLAPSVLDRSVRRYFGLLRAPAPPVSALPLTAELRVGPYRIERVLGHGGMGTVYLARRERIDHRVAIKLIASGRQSAAVLERFRREQEILASLQHPNIARLLDAAADERDRAYIVMEYVDGVPITEYCDARRLGVDERIRLFRSVCDAVQYAHAKLVVHRDIKPSNILVTSQGEVKLLDFGIAKLLSDIESNVTRTGDVVGTLLYAAPEQLGARPVSTAADTYSLGVVLYELLTGRLPLHPAGRNPLDWPRIVAEEAPVRPSVVASIARAEATPAADVQDAEPAAAARGTTAARLQRKLAGDLDTIALRALAKEPERRYPSAAALRDDLERHLAHQPVAARADTATYRLRKFVRRNRSAVAAAALFTFLLLGGLGATTWQARARSVEAQRAGALLRILLDALRFSDPDVAEGAQVTARDVLDRAAARVLEEPAAQPSLGAELQLVIADIYRDLGMHSSAEPLVQRALETRMRLFGPDHEAVAEVLRARGWLHYLESEYEPAERLLRQALAIQQRSFGSADTVVARTQDNLAQVLRASGRLEEALARAQEALATRRAILGRHADVAQSLNNTAVIQRQLGGLDAAESMLREALSTYTALGRDDDRDVLSTVNNLGMVLRAHGRRDEAADMFADLAARQEARYGRTHPLTITSVNNLGAVLTELGRIGEAEAMFRDVLERYAERGEPDHLNAVTARANLADLMNRSGRSAEAEALQREVLATFRTVFGDANPSTAIAMHNLASTLSSAGRPAEAEALYRRSLEILRASLPSDHPNVAIVSAGLGRALALQDRCAEAEPALRAAIRTMNGNAATRTRAGSPAVELGICLMRLGRLADAERQLLDALPLVAADSAALERTHRALTDIYTMRGDTLQAARHRARLRGGR